MEISVCAFIISEKRYNLHKNHLCLSAYKLSAFFLMNANSELILRGRMPKIFMAQYPSSIKKGVRFPKWEGLRSGKKIKYVFNLTTCNSSWESHDVTIFKRNPFWCISLQSSRCLSCNWQQVGTAITYYCCDFISNCIRCKNHKNFTTKSILMDAGRFD